MITDKLGNIESIRIENFRLFKNVKFDFSPITILVGPNSSGKSSFIKSLLLINENNQNKAWGSCGIDFSDPKHEVGSLELCKANDKELVYEFYVQGGVSFKYSINNNEELSSEEMLINKKSVVIVRRLSEPIEFPWEKEMAYYFTHEFNLVGLVKYFKTLITSFKRIEANRVIIGYGNYISLQGVGDEIYDLFTAKKKKEDFEFFKTDLYDGLIVTRSLLDEFKRVVINLKNILAQYKKENIEPIVFIEEKDGYNNIVNGGIDGSTSYTATELASYFMVKYVFLFSVLKNFDIVSDIGNTNLIYVPALKGLHKRYLPISDDTALSKILDLKSLSFRNNSYSEFYKFQSDMGYDSVIKDASLFFAERWLKKFNIGNKLELIKDKKRGIKHIEVDGKSLVDKGYGLTQLVAIIYSIKEAIKREGTVILEEPETNLHPKFQSMLADMIVAAKRGYHVSFIIETHSEYLIRKLQYFTAKKDLKPEDTVIYYFHPPNEIPKGEKQVKKLTIREDGMMDGDFGEGFFDESARLTMDLLKIQSQN